MAQDNKISDKVQRSPTETAGKGGEWGFLQNKVNRASKVAIPLDVYLKHSALSGYCYDNGFVIYATPLEYFSGQIPNNLVQGKDYIVFYSTQTQLESNPPLPSWKIFEIVNPDGKSVDKWCKGAQWRGDYYVRVKSDNKWIYGPGKVKAIGIRQDEYCSKLDQGFIVGQMAYLAWSIPGTRAKFGVSNTPQYLLDFLSANNMLDLQRMQAVGMINARGIAQCPFCRNELTYQDLVDQANQQVGRQLSSSNATALHLMHIDPLKMGTFNHKPYNLAFGHAKCNHAQGEDPISESISFLFKRRLTDALTKENIPDAVQERIANAVEA